MANIVDLVHRDTGVSLMKLSATPDLATQVVYYGSVVDETSVRFLTPLSSKTTFLMRAYPTSLRVWSNSGGSTKEYLYVRDVFVNEHYSLYISSPVGVSATGTITRVQIRGELKVSFCNIFPFDVVLS